MAEIKTMRLVLMLFSFLILYGAMIFLPAGTLEWPEAWVYLIVQLGSMGVIAVWLWRHDPDLLKERLSMGDKGAKKWDSYVRASFFLIIVAFFYVAAVDATNYHWSAVPMWMKSLGVAGLIVIMTWMAWVMKENSYLSRVVRIQRERGQKVVTTGPYAFVRHPMYAGFLWYLPTISLTLGSYYAMLVAIPFDSVLIVRTYLEDKTLQRELDGYKEYTQKTRYRLIPKIW